MCYSNFSRGFKHIKDVFVLMTQPAPEETIEGGWAYASVKASNSAG